MLVPSQINHIKDKLLKYQHQRPLLGNNNVDIVSYEWYESLLNYTLSSLKELNISLKNNLISTLLSKESDLELQMLLEERDEEAIHELRKMYNENILFLITKIDFLDQLITL